MNKQSNVVWLILSFVIGMSAIILSAENVPDWSCDVMIVVSGILCGYNLAAIIYKRF